MLYLGLDIDKKVSTAYKILRNKGRITQDIVMRKDDL